MVHFFLYLLLRCLLWAFYLLPKSCLPAFGRGFGTFLHLVGLRKNVVTTNLQIAFGASKSSEEIAALCRLTYRNIGSNMFEFFMLERVSPEELGNYVTLEGAEILEAALTEGKGVVMAGGHFGHWELLSAALNRFVRPFYGYAGKQDNPLFDEWINEIRAKFGMKTISKSKGATREMLKVLKNNEVLGILGDLNVPNRNLFVEFFGLQAAVGEGLATFVVKGKRPLLFNWIHRLGPLTHHAVIERLDYQLTGDDAADVARVAQLIMTRLQHNIEAFPDHYFWFNRRFKTRPLAEKEQGITIYHEEP